MKEKFKHPRQGGTWIRRPDGSLIPASKNSPPGRGGGEADGVTVVPSQTNDGGRQDAAPTLETENARPVRRRKGE